MIRRIGDSTEDRVNYDVIPVIARHNLEPTICAI
jgi:hypothetical protein